MVFLPAQCDRHRRVLLVIQCDKRVIFFQRVPRLHPDSRQDAAVLGQHTVSHDTGVEQPDIPQCGLIALLRLLQRIVKTGSLDLVPF